ncbi:A alpha-helical domain with a conserved ER moti [Brevundimonas sp. Leaf363]|uniref:alpha-E domain-containing protein n=1 Tax=Brevundimonas sp. Leaf363 TaxID=1736353 RepID=UPI000700F71A|nr:alpha-E domain-containing protein [Brevundimonas sp. Leaf363]KQS53698.1 A alpha-helical domain with a conserved ER moti [Brevundimonas sp. Leaf363]
MLSRTAESLYWTGRYMERADFLARILEAAVRLAALPAKDAAAATAWASALASAGASTGFEVSGRAVSEKSVRDYLAFSPENGSSIRACLTRARTNARSVRTALTIELWEAINGAYNGLADFGEPGKRDDFVRFLEWVKGVSLAFEGAASRTMLRNDGYWFLRLGMAIERADNTARLLDVKYHLLLPAGERVGGQLDYFQWTTLLREVSALTAYRWVYRESVRPWLVADLMVLNRQMPRSLASCQGMIVSYLEKLATDYGRRGPAQRMASARLSQFNEAKIEDIFQSGLHEYIQRFLAENNGLAASIHDQYLV